MSGALHIFVRGFGIVFLTALNVYQVSHGHHVGAFIGGFLISAIWWGNAHASAHSHVEGGWCWYGLGAGLGTVCGLLAGEWFYG